MKSDISAHIYFPVADAAIAMGLYLTGAGQEVAAPNTAYPQPIHPDMYMFSWKLGRVLPEYQLVYVYEGRGEFESHETGHIPIEPGTALLLIPDVWHRYRPAITTGWRVGYICFNGQIPHIWQLAGLISPAHAVRQISDPKPLEQSLDKIIHAAVEHPGGAPQGLALMALTALTIVLGDGTQTGLRTAPHPTLSEDKIVDASLKLIWNHSHRNLSVADIARHLKITRRTLTRHFLKACGCGVLDELTACRLSRAQRMLRETHLPIKRIAYAAGFSSPTHLAMVFRRTLQMTPGQYRGRKLK